MLTHQNYSIDFQPPALCELDLDRCVSDRGRSVVPEVRARTYVLA